MEDALMVSTTRTPILKACRSGAAIVVTASVGVAFLFGVR